MNTQDLIDALSRLGIAELRSMNPSEDGITCVFEGRLPSPPFAPRFVLITHTLNATRDGSVEPDDIESLLLHFWQAQHELRDLTRAVKGLRPRKLGLKGEGRPTRPEGRLG
jgi:hypothetical protein